MLFNYRMSHSNMYGYDETEEEEMEEEELDQSLYDTIRYSLMGVKAIMYVLNELVVNIGRQRLQRPLTRQPKTTSGYDYIRKILNEDPTHFRQVYRMYPDVFLKLCSIIREKTVLHDTRFICIEEMLAIFLLNVGQNSRYCLVRKTFGRSHFTISQCFNKILRALNTIAVDMMAKPKSTVEEKIRESTRFYPYFKVSDEIIYF